MNKRKKYLLAFGTLFPLATFASGGEILEWVWIEFLLISVFVLTVVLVNLNWTGKGLMIFVFIVTEYLAMKLTDDLPYTENKVMINVASIIAPTLTTIGSYLILKLRFKKKTN